MNFKRNIYQKKEVDLRDNFDSLVFGKGGGLAHNHLVLIRRPKRDSEKKLIKCGCVSQITDEAHPTCTVCLGERYVWEEKLHRCYSTYVGADGGKANRTRRLGLGEIRTDFKIFYFKFNTVFSYKDKIIEIGLDNEGAPSVPYIRETIYRPETIQKYRGDNGRVEYIAIYCREESSIRQDI